MYFLFSSCELPSKFLYIFYISVLILLLSWLLFFRGIYIYILLSSFLCHYRFWRGPPITFFFVFFFAHLSKDLASFRWLRETDTAMLHWCTLSMQLLNGMIEHDHQFSVYNSQSMHVASHAVKETWRYLKCIIHKQKWDKRSYIIPSRIRVPKK